MSLTKLSLGNNYDVIFKLFLHRESLVSDIPAGHGNIEKLFFTVKCLYIILPPPENVKHKYNIIYFSLILSEHTVSNTRNRYCF